MEPLVDLAALAAAGATTELLRAAGPSSTPWSWRAVFWLLVLVQLYVRGAYVRGLRHDLLDELRMVAVATAVAGMGVLTFRLLLGATSAPVGSARETAREWVFATVYLLAARYVLRRWAARREPDAPAGSPTLIFGAGRVGELLARRLLPRESGLEVVGFLDKEPLQPDSLPVPVLGASWQLEDVVREHSIEHLVVSFSTAPTDVVLDLVQRCGRLGVTVSIVPRLFESVHGRIAVDYVGGIPLLTPYLVDPHGWQFRCKHALDRVLAAVILVFLLPSFAVIAVAVRLSCGSPVLFRQLRVGRDRKLFEMLKFRSMRDPDDSDGGSVPAPPDGIGPGGVEGEDRRTRLGTFLRRQSLDELPQLLNVIKGEMSLVGPRPERPEFVRMFEQNVPRYGDRHRVKVGITGWAQIHGLRGNTSLQDRVEWDNYYIENWSLWLDLKILISTIAALIRPHSPTE